MFTQLEDRLKCPEEGVKDDSAGRSKEGLHHAQRERRHHVAAYVLEFCRFGVAHQLGPEDDLGAVVGCCVELHASLCRLVLDDYPGGAISRVVPRGHGLVDTNKPRGMITRLHVLIEGALKRAYLLKAAGGSSSVRDKGQGRHNVIKADSREAIPTKLVAIEDGVRKLLAPELRP